MGFGLKGGESMAGERMRAKWEETGGLIISIRSMGDYGLERPKGRESRSRRASRAHGGISKNAPMTVCSNFLLSAAKGAHSFPIFSGPFSQSPARG